MEHGSPVHNLHPHFSERIQVTSSDIQVLNIDVSDMGNYTLSDRDDRKVKVITPNFIREFPHLKYFQECTVCVVIC